MRSSDSARCAPRLVSTMEWISSMMTVSTVFSISRAREVRMRYSDSGVVMRMSGGSRRIFSRSDWGVSPLRTATLGTRCASPARSAVTRMPLSGARRFRSTSTPSALSGET